MKTKITGLILIFIIMGMVPLFALQTCSAPVKTVFSAENTEDAKSAVSMSSAEQKLCGLIAAQYNEDWNDEMLDAVSVLIKTGYSVSPDQFDLENRSVYMTEQNRKDKWKARYAEYTARIANSISQTKNLYICYNNKPVYTPYFASSKGYTEKSDTYEHLISVASPWDQFSAVKNQTDSMAGVCLNGLQFLTDQGENAENALLWYLPLCEIQTIPQ